MFKPLVDRLDPVQDWGTCEEEQKKEFSQVFDKFAVELKEALKAMPRAGGSWRSPAPNALPFVSGKVGSNLAPGEGQGSTPIRP